MTVEQIKPARKRVTPSFPRSNSPAKFVGEPGYIKSDKFDRAVAWALGLGVVVILGTTDFPLPRTHKDTERITYFSLPQSARSDNVLKAKSLKNHSFLGILSDRTGPVAKMPITDKKGEKRGAAEAHPSRAQEN